MTKTEFTLHLQLRSAHPVCCGKSFTGVSAPNHHTLNPKQIVKRMLNFVKWRVNGGVPAKGPSPIKVLGPLFKVKAATASRAPATAVPASALPAPGSTTPAPTPIIPASSAAPNHAVKPFPSNQPFPVVVTTKLP